MEIFTQQQIEFYAETWSAQLEKAIDVLGRLAVGTGIERFGEAVEHIRAGQRALDGIAANSDATRPEEA
ncbi:hypothetical protein [Rhizobium sp. BK176]|uniref:hypothetical protein n=1 Tax=Rhizobium sp. BK176 TaxID=2587071 RepID=UPI0021674E7B|nr:hypothetical protein [Rhizobium sp. BK176]MCS4088486.1 hypothetical protein [Rhizobium sp. BK176]